MIDPERIWKSSQLPSLPTVVVRLLELTNDPDTDVSTLVEVIRADPAITGKILRAVNSSYFGFKSEVKGLHRAVPLLGTSTVMTLALSFHLSSHAVSKGPLATHYRTYWLQSVVQGLAAELLAQRCESGMQCEYFLAGLIMDVGRLAMLKTIPEEYSAVLDEFTGSDLDLNLTELERNRLGFTHTDISRRMLESWNLPGAFLNAVRYQHASLETLKEADIPAHRELVQAVVLASLVGDYYCTSNKGRAFERLQQYSEAFFGSSRAETESFLTAVGRRVEAAAELFSIDPDVIPAPADLISQANEQLSQMAFRAQMAKAQAVARQWEIEREKDKLAMHNRVLQKQAIFDRLTEAYNRAFLEEALDKELDHCRRRALPIGVVFLDLDHFKNINDTYGHQFGDEVLVRVAKTLKEGIRDEDVLARYGGEEFVLLVTQPSEKGLEAVAERLRSRVEALRSSADGKEVSVTVSVGASLALPGPNDMSIRQRLLSTADMAMYDAKRNGRNQTKLKSLLSDDERTLLQDILKWRFSRFLVRNGAIDVRQAAMVLQECQTTHIPFGQIAVDFGWLDESEVLQVLERQQMFDVRFGEVAQSLNLLTEDQIVKILARQQEDPDQFATTAERLGVLSSDQATNLLTEYLDAVGCRTLESVSW